MEFIKVFKKYSYQDFLGDQLAKTLLVPSAGAWVRPLVRKLDSVCLK